MLIASAKMRQFQMGNNANMFNPSKHIKRDVEYKPKVLVVDDQESNIYSMKQLLKKVPLELDVAYNGSDALNMMVKYEYALILLDVNMPGMDGFEVASLAQKDANFNKAPIIFLTAFDDDNTFVSKGYEVGAVDYLVKPVDQRILLGKIEVFLELYRQKIDLQHLIEELADAKGRLANAIDELEHLALNDSLTGLPNRAQFEEVLVQVIAHCERHDTIMAVLFIDLDKFKITNDTLGHDAGDALLKYAAKKLKQSLRKGDFLARIGGDEFAVILHDLKDSHGAGVVANKLIKCLEAPLQYNHKEIYTSASIGIASYPHSGDTHSILLKNADIAMYRAKTSGGNNYQYFSPELNDSHMQRINIELALQSALEKDELSLVYLPKYSLLKSKIIGVEVLLRWENPNLGLVSPAIFIPISEELRLMGVIGEWVIEQSCQQYVNWVNEGIQDVQLSINISVTQLIQPGFVKLLQANLERQHINTSQIELEVTETAFIKIVDEAANTIKHLHELGVTLTLDDFGTGFSSLSRIMHLPFSRLKIDLELIQNIEKSEQDRLLIKSMINLAKSMELEVVAEGVENDVQVTFLKENHCDVIQGYYYSKPLVANAMLKLLKKG